MMLSSCNAWAAPSTLTSERAMYDALPETVLLDVPLDVLHRLDIQGYPVKCNYTFHISDLVQDCLTRTKHKDSSEGSLEEWFDEVCADLIAQDWMDANSTDYLNAIGEFFDALRYQICYLYTPSGHHYYEFVNWLDKSTIMLKKSRYVE